MRKSKEQTSLYLANIRRLMVVQHDMSAPEMKKQLEKLGLRFDVKYIRRLKEKVLGERKYRADRMTLNSALATFQDVMAETSHIAWQIALSPQSSKRDRIAALKEIREAHRDVFDKLFDAGVFDRKLGTIDTNILRARPLEPEVEAEILEAFQRWGGFPKNNANDGAKPIESTAAVQQS